MLEIRKYNLFKNMKRELFIYKSDNFKKNPKSMIFIIHDANFFFDKKYCPFGTSINIVKTLQSLGYDNFIIAGLKNLPGDKRYKEFSVTNLNKKVSNDLKIEVDDVYGIEYVDHIKTKLIPYLEDEFDFEFNNIQSYMIGLSLGGSVTLYSALEYPTWFTGYMAFSSALSVNSPYIKEYISKKKTVGRLFYSGGGEEVSESVENKKVYIDAYNFLNYKFKDLENTHGLFFKEGKHKIIEWEKQLPKALKWIIK